jgi:hypothetical protein
VREEARLGTLADRRARQVVVDLVVETLEPRPNVEQVALVLRGLSMNASVVVVWKVLPG